MPGPVHVYSALVADPKDFVGALAYSIYKQTKVAWIINLKASNGDADPTPAELAVFHAAQMTPIQLQGYRDRAQALSAYFLRIACDLTLLSGASDDVTSARASVALLQR